MQIIVYSEDNGLAAQLISLAKGTVAGSAVTVIAAAPNAAALSDKGADALMSVAAPEGACSDDMACTVAAIAKEKAADAVLVGATRSGRAVAARVAAMLDAPVVSDIASLSGEGAVQARWSLYGGKLVQDVKGNGSLTVFTVGAGKAEPIQGASDVTEAAYVAPANPIEVLGTEARAKSDVNLADSDIIVCAGRGAASPERLALCRGLAESLHGDLGCTRPVTEGNEPLMPVDLYIGASGVTVKPNLYIGVGVSGQTQHTIGLQDSKIVVSIDKNKDCLMFRQADYCLCAEIDEIVPALTAALAG